MTARRPVALMGSKIYQLYCKSVEQMLQVVHAAIEPF